MLQTVEKLTKEKVPLSVPLIASYLSKHYKPADIARACNVSNEAVKTIQVTDTFIKSVKTDDSA